MPTDASSPIFTSSNSVSGTIKADRIIGGSSKYLVGGLGDDIYELYRVSDLPYELASDGIDTVRINYWGSATLADNLENLELLSGGATSGTGNALANRITAGIVHATLDGRGGNDTLVGGVGADVFKVGAGNGSDTILNFQSGFDAISLSGYGITSFAGIQAIARQVNQDVSLSFGNGETLTIKDVALGGLTAYDFALPATPSAAKGLGEITGATKVVSANGWMALNNAWGSSTLKEGTDFKVSTVYNSKDLTSGTTFSWSYALSTEAFQTVKAYPDLMFGHSPYGTPNPTDLVRPFPIQVSAISSLAVDFAVAFAGNKGGFNVAFDVWLTKVPGGDRSTVTNEIMVVLHKPDLASYGDVVGEYVDGGQRASIYHKDTYTAVVFDKDVPEGTLDLAKLLAKLGELGIVSRDEYLASVQLGAEVFSGSGELTIKNLDVTMQSVDGKGHILQTVIDGTGTTVTDVTSPKPVEPVVETPVTPALPAVVSKPAAVSEPEPQNISAAKDTLILKLNQDFFQGDNARFKVLVDGQQVGAVYEAKAIRKNGETETLTLTGNWGSGAHKVTVTFLNDAYSSATQDRNLHVASISYNGKAIDNAVAHFWGNGSAIFDVPAGTGTPIPPEPAANDKLVLKVAQDFLVGEDARFKVFVDGKQVGDVYSAKSIRKDGKFDTLTLNGDWGPGTHKVSVTFLNDGNNTAAQQDRNLHVLGATYNGVAIVDGVVHLWGNGSAGFDIPASNPAAGPLNLVGTAGNDTLVGGSAADRIAGGLGKDTLTGAGGSDTFVFSKKGGADTVIDFTAKGSAADVIAIDGYAFSKFEHLKSFIKQSGADTVITLNATDSVTLKNVVAADLTQANVSFSNVVSPSTGKLSVGVNLAGAEYIGPKGEKSGIDYFPTHEEIEFFAAKGMNEFRFPIAWENLQPKLGGPLDSAYLAKLKDVIAYADKLGVDAIIDMHNYGSYGGNLIGSAKVPTSAFADVWSKLATEFKSADNVRFDLMNEPQQETAAEWLAITNAAIAAIRATGATQEVLVTGVHWSGAQTWTTTDNGSVIGKPGAVVDPLNKFTYTVHLYLDDTSGKHDWVVSPTIGVERLTAITDWARAAGVKLFLGEIGAADNAKSLVALDNTFAYLKANQDVWEGVSYWGASPSWQDYIFSLEAKLGLLDTAQMDVLEKYIDTTVTRTAQADGTVKVETFGHGTGHASIVDIVDAKNELVSRTVYDAAGKLAGKLLENSDGTTTVSDYVAATGKIEDIKVYDAAQKMIKDSIYAADQSYTLNIYDTASGSVVRNEKHSADEKLVDVVETNANAIITSHFENGTITQAQTFTLNWSLIDTLKYDASGKVSEHSYVTGDRNVIEKFNAGGTIATHGEFTLDWKTILWTNFNADGSKSTTIDHADGTKYVESYHSNADEPYKIDHYTADWHLIGSVLG